MVWSQTEQKIEAQEKYNEIQRLYMESIFAGQPNGEELSRLWKECTEGNKMSCKEFETLGLDNSRTRCLETRSDCATTAGEFYKIGDTSTARELYQYSCEGENYNDCLEWVDFEKKLGNVNKVKEILDVAKRICLNKGHRCLELAVDFKREGDLNSAAELLEHGCKLNVPQLCLIWAGFQFTHGDKEEAKKITDRICVETKADCKYVESMAIQHGQQWR